MHMKHDPILRTKRRATNVTLPEDVLEQARQFGINVSKACEAGLRVAVHGEVERRWEEEHRERIDKFSAWLDRNGMPFEDLRLF